MFSRRGVLLLAATAAQGCAGPAPPPPPLAALDAGLPGRPQRQPLLLLDVARIEVAPIPAGPAFFVIPPAPIMPADAMVAMARERLRAAGNARTALFSVLTARLGRHPEDPGRLFSGRTEMLQCTLRCRLDILASEGGALLGTTGAEVQRSATVPASSAAERAESSARFMRVAMADLELEFENQIRRDLGAFLADRIAAGSAQSG